MNNAIALSHPVAAAAFPETDEITRVVGKNLRRLRLQRGLPLERLAHLSGVSRAMLSHIELGQSAPTIKTLDKIAEALEIPFTALLYRSERKSAFLLKSEESKILITSDGKARFRSLFPYDIQAGRNVEFYEFKLVPLSRHVSEPHASGTFENLVVQQGHLEVTTGRETHKLGPGDSLYFAGDVPHAYVNPGNDETILYLVMIHSNKEGL